MVIIGVVVPFFSLLPLFFAFSDRQTSASNKITKEFLFFSRDWSYLFNEQTGFLIVMVGVPVSFIIYAALLEVKNKSEKF